MFSTVNPDLLKDIKATYTVNQTVKSLGFYKEETYNILIIKILLLNLLQEFLIDYRILISFR